MANTAAAIKRYIATERKRGKSDNQILIGLTKQPGTIGKSVNGFAKEARQNGLSPTQSLAKVFDLKIGAVDPKANNKVAKKKAGFMDGLKASAASMTTALVSDIGGGLLQGNAYVGDKINSGVNRILGTNLDTNAYERTTNMLEKLNHGTKILRAQAGLDGVDLTRMGTEAVLTAPLYAIGGAPSAGAKGLSVWAGKQAAIGAGTGAARYAKDNDERMVNTVGGAIGGAVGGVAGEKVLAPGVRRAGSVIARRSANKSGNTARAARKLVDDAIKRTGITVDDVAKAHLIDDATKALSTGRELDAAALIRKKLLDDHGIKGTKAQITRDPNVWAAEREAAKHSPALNDVHIENHQQLDALMKKLIDDTGATPVDTHTKIDSTFKSLRQVDDMAQKKVSDLYSAAREMSGNDAQLNHLRFIDQASRELEENGVGSFMKGDIKGIFKGMFDDPDFVLTHAKAEEINKVLNARIRTTTDGNERHALGIIKKNLQKEVDNTIDDMGDQLGHGDSDGGLAGAQEAWQKARGAARERFGTLENTPALKAAIDGVEPDKAFDKFILRGNAADILRTVEQLKKVPGGQQNIADLQGAAIEHFLSNSTNNAGAFSPHQLNRALESFGNQRMKALFTPQQIARLNDIKKVADILVQQPNGAHVNHSNTANVLIKQLLNIVNVAGKMPVLGNAMLGGIGAVGSLSKGGAAAKMINGQVPATKGSSLGLSPEQLRMLGLLARGSSTTTSAGSSAVGASVGD